MKLRSIASLLLAAGCAGNFAGTRQEKPAGPERRLLVLHASDLEAELLGDAEAGGIARMAALLRALRGNSAIPTITVAAGDTFMPAPALRLAEDAVGPANDLLGFDASALGNHEFDLGEAALAERIGKAAFPYLTATVDFAGGPLDDLDLEPGEIDGSTPWLATMPGRILPRGRICAGGELLPAAEGMRCTGLTVGVIGATTETLAQISSTPVAVRLPADFTALRGIIQAQADALAAEGVDVVILLSHLQDVRAELRLVEEGLRGVDLIVSGGGDDRLADGGDRLLPGDEPHPLCAGEASCYPLLRTAADGLPVAIVATDGQLRYVGSLELSFDERGVLSGIDPASRPWPVDERSLAELAAPTAVDALAIEERVRRHLHATRDTIASSVQPLNGEREAIRNRETNLGNLASDSLAWAARKQGRQIAFALRNAGGIRASIGVGEITRLAIGEALRFDNEVVVVQTSRRLLVEALESSLRGAGTGRGHFPQVSAEVELVYDPGAAEQVQRIVEGEVVGVDRPGARIRRLAIAGEVLVEEGALVDPDAPIAFVTLGYLARGGDGFFPGAASSLVVEELGLREQQALALYLESLDAAGAWKQGASYLDPDPASPTSFRRIRWLQ